MRSLLRKDLILLKNYKRSVLLMILFLAISIISSSFSTKDITMSIYIVLMSSLFLMFSLSYSSLFYDDISKFDEYIKFMPVENNLYIKSKYYFALIIYILEFIIMAVVGIKLLGFQNINIALILISAQILTGGILINIFFKYGQEKMKSISTGIFLMSLVFILLIVKFGNGIISIGLLTIEYLKILPFILVFISIIIFFIIMKLTINREMEKC